MHHHFLETFYELEDSSFHYMFANRDNEMDVLTFRATANINRKVSLQSYLELFSNRDHYSKYVEYDPSENIYTENTAFIKGEQVITTQKEAERRWEICKKCPHLLYDETNPDTNKKDGRCPLCGCFMNVKVHYAVAHCPLDKWQKDCGCSSDCECHGVDCDEN